MAATHSSRNFIILPGVLVCDTGLSFFMHCAGSHNDDDDGDVMRWMVIDCSSGLIIGPPHKKCAGS